MDGKARPPSTEHPEGLLPAFSARPYAHLPTPQSPGNGRYAHDRAYSPESPIPNGMVSASQSRRVGNRATDLEGNSTRSQSALQQCITPESSPHFSNNFPLDPSGSATPRYFVPSSTNDFSTPRQISTKLDPTDSVSLPGGVAPRMSTPSSPQIHPPNHSAILSSPFMAKLSIGDNASNTAMPPSEPRPSHVDDIFSSSQPLDRSTILTTSISTPPLSPFHPSTSNSMTGAGGELERIRHSMMEDRLTQIREAEKRRPEYLKRAKRTLSEADPSYLEEEENERAVGIMESPHKGRRLKLFQETSEESFEESLMAGGYGRYRTADWVRQPQPISLPSSAIAGSSTIISLLEEAEEAPPSEKELKKRKRLAAFRETPQNISKLCAVELEGKGRVLIDIPVEEQTTPGSPEPAPTKKKAPNRRKKKVNDVILSKKAFPGIAEDQVEKPNWPDAEFPWRVRTEERLELAKAEDEERLRWIERFLDRDSDDEDEVEAAPLTRLSSPGPYDFVPEVPRPGRGKMVPLIAYPDNARRDGPVKRSAFPSDPADARAALLSKKSVRALSYRQQKRERDDDDDEVVCICNGKDDGRELVQCDACQTWYHLECIGIKSIAELGKEEDPWFCRRCVARSRSPSTEPDDASTSEPTFVPSEEPSVRRSSDTPFYQPGLQDSPNWSSSRMPKTPTRGYHNFADSQSSWIDSSRPGPSTPQHAPPSVRIYSSPYDIYPQNFDESPFDPTSTPSRGIRFHAPFATPKSHSWMPRGGAGLFQTPSRPSVRGSANKVSGSISLASDDSVPHHIPPHEPLGRTIPYDESPIRRSGDASMARRTLHSPSRTRPLGQSLSFLEESPVMQSVGSQLQKKSLDEGA